MITLRRPSMILAAALFTSAFLLWNSRTAIARFIKVHLGERSLAPIQVNTFQSAVERTEHHYGRTIDELAKDLDLPPSYLKALVVLECSGKEKVTPRFEPHVFRKLVSLRIGSISSYAGLRHKDVKNASDAALKNLASSWGPFQLMGYQCVAMDVKVHDIRGDSALYWGMKWIDHAYGKRLRKGQFKHAFHIHNTGRPHPRNGKPRTHDPKYCDRGLAYMKKFDRVGQPHIEHSLGPHPLSLTHIERKSR